MWVELTPQVIELCKADTMCWSISKSSFILSYTAFAVSMLGRWIAALSGMHVITNTIENNPYSHLFYNHLLQAVATIGITSQNSAPSRQQLHLTSGSALFSALTDQLMFCLPGIGIRRGRISQLRFPELPATSPYTPPSHKWHNEILVQVHTSSSWSLVPPIATATVPIIR